MVLHSNPENEACPDDGSADEAGMHASGRHRILVPGRNCWRISHADRVAFLVDGEQYFDAFREAVKKVEHQLLILSWDIDSRFRLTWKKPADGLPVKLGRFLNAIVKNKPALHAYVLSWDYSMIFAMAREWLPFYRFYWKTDKRLKFKLDDQHASGASHHQKVVAIDDTMAFSGGLDLTLGRWDSSHHAPNDARRRRTNGTMSRPYHDIQIAVEGAAAASLGDLARMRWERATEEKLKACPRPQVSPWPDTLEADLKNVEVAISRTVGPLGEDDEIREVEQLNLDAVAAARSRIYIENQYFNVQVFTDALAARLREEDGPEVVMVLPLCTEGWFAQQSLDVMRIEHIDQLRQADVYGRFAVYYPHVTGLTRETSINVHAKIMIVDDMFVRVGSSNLNNRSMALDSECDISIESLGEENAERGIAAFRHRCLAEHLGVTTEDFARAFERAGTLIEAIEENRGRSHSLWPLEPMLPRPAEGTLADDAVMVDPDKPLCPEGVIQDVISKKEMPSASRQLIGFIALVLLMLGLTLAWRWIPLPEGFSLDSLDIWAGRVADAPILSALIAICIFVVASLLAIPVTLMVAATGLLFGTGFGFAIALAGTNLSSATTYWLGSLVGGDTVRNLGGEKVQRVSAALRRRGILTMLVLRVVPIAPFTLINLVAGALKIRFRDYAIGTLAGTTPGVFAVIILTDRIDAAVRTPSPGSIAILIAVGAAIFAGATALVRAVLRRLPQ